MTTRLVDSPACLVVDEGDMSGHLARLLKQAGPGRAEVAADRSRSTPSTRWSSASRASAHFDDLAHILFDQALLAEGGQLEDPAAYVQRVNAAAGRPEPSQAQSSVAELGVSAAIARAARAAACACWAQ